MSAGLIARPALLIRRHTMAVATTDTAALAPPRVLTALALTLNVAVSFALAPVSANPFDLAVLNGTANSWLSWGTPLFLYWKFGFNYSALNVAAMCAARVLVFFGVSTAAAQHIAFKLPLILSNLLIAWLLHRLAQHVAPPRARWVLLIWLLSPVGVWVAAGHAQIEPVAIASLLGSLLLIARRRMLMAGVVAGLGVGFEYFPLVAAATMLALWSGRRISVKQLAIGWSGVALGIVASFGPVLATAFGRLNFVGGVIAHSAVSASEIDQKPGSVWSMTHISLSAPIIESYWFLWLGGAVLFVTWLAGRRCRRTDSDLPAMAATGGALILAVIIDPTTLPQFAVIAEVGLLLMWLSGVGMPVWLVALTPILAVVAYFFSDQWYVYFEDVTPNVLQLAGNHQLLPELPLSLRAYAIVANVYAAGLSAAVAWFVVQRRPSFRPPGWAMSATLVQGAVLVTLAIWALQPSLWLGVVSNGPRHLFEAPYLTSYRRGTVTSSSPTHIVKLDPILVAAVNAGRVQPFVGIEVEADPLVDARGVGLYIDGTRLMRVDVTSPSIIDGYARRLWVVLLAHNDAWVDGGRVAGTALIDGHLATPAARQAVVGRWYTLTYSVPVSWLHLSDRDAWIELEMRESGTRLNSSDGLIPWIFTGIQDGVVPVTVPGYGTRNAELSADWAGRGMVVDPDLQALDAGFTLDASMYPGLEVTSAGYVWPNADDEFSKLLSPGWTALGAGFLALGCAGLIGCGMVILRPRRPSRPQPDADAV